MKAPQPETLKPRHTPGAFLSFIRRRAPRDKVHGLPRRGLVVFLFLIMLGEVVENAINPLLRPSLIGGLFLALRSVVTCIVRSHK